MVNVLFELEQLRVALEKRGISSRAADQIVAKALNEIQFAMDEHAKAAMQQAIEAGVEKKSPDFINELMFDAQRRLLTVSSGNTDFSEPPFPMLPSLLKHAKPIKDGSGVYKVIPIGAPSKIKKSIATNIFDAQKQISAKRIEDAKEQYARVAPKGSKTQFRTATSKQNAASQWVMPAKEKNFEEDLSIINKELTASIDSTIVNIIREYTEGFL